MAQDGRWCAACLRDTSVSCCRNWQLKMRTQRPFGTPCAPCKSVQIRFEEPGPVKVRATLVERGKTSAPECFGAVPRLTDDAHRLLRVPPASPTRLLAISQRQVAFDRIARCHKACRLTPTWNTGKNRRCTEALSSVLTQNAQNPERDPLQHPQQRPAESDSGQRRTLFRRDAAIPAKFVPGGAVPRHLGDQPSLRGTHTTLSGAAGVDSKKGRGNPRTGRLGGVVA